MPDPILEYALSRHAALEMGGRGIAETIVRAVLAAPEQRELVRRVTDAHKIEFQTIE